MPIGCCAGAVVEDAAAGLVLLDRADLAMRRAETRGVGSVESSTADSHRLGARHPRLRSLSIDAVARREIEVQFQPVVDMASGRIIEFESLARWTSIELGSVDPIQFIEAAEDTGLIHELGRCVLDTTLDIVHAEQVALRWGDRRVSVNFSAVQVAHPELSTRVAAALSSRGLPGAVLQLELTQTQLMPDITATAVNPAELRRLGMRITVDDYGTGCANMSYLRDLPVDSIKIDRRFISNMCTSVADTASIRSIVALAGELRIDVTAVGVETVDQHFALARPGCPSARGFLYAEGRDPHDLYAPVQIPHRPPADATTTPLPADVESRTADHLPFPDRGATKQGGGRNKCLRGVPCCYFA